MSRIALLHPEPVSRKFGAELRAIHPCWPGNWFVQCIKRLAWRIVKNGGYVSFRSDITVVNTDDTKPLLETIFESQWAIREVFRGECKYVVVGRDHAHRLYGEAASKHQFQFAIEAPLSFHGTLRVFGLTVIVVPWIEGIALLPEIKESA